MYIADLVDEKSEINKSFRIAGSTGLFDQSTVSRVVANRLLDHLYKNLYKNLYKKMFSMPSWGCS